MFGSIGMPELLIILTLALIIFGPRKLPELGRSLGKSLGEFKRASNELRNTLDEEIRIEEERSTRPARPADARRAGTSHRCGDRRDARTRPCHAIRDTRSARWRPFRLSSGRCRSLPTTTTTSLIELTDPQEVELDAGRMSFLEHLDELRKRLIAGIIGIAVGCVASFIFLDKYIFPFIMLPMQRMLPEGGKLITTEASEFFMLWIKVGFFAGLLIAMPFILYQLWLFVAPGLYSHEKRFAIPFVLFASIFFFGGAMFSHYVAFPVTWGFFITFNPSFVQFMPKIGPAFALYVKMAARLRRGVPDAGAGLRAGAHGDGDGRLPAAQLQVRRPHHRDPRRGPQPGRRHRLADDPLRPDARALHHQHRRRLGVPEAQARRRSRELGPDGCLHTTSAPCCRPWARTATVAKRRSPV